MAQTTVVATIFIGVVKNGEFNLTGGEIEAAHGEGTSQTEVHRQRV